jgi:hypothetical protein
MNTNGNDEGKFVTSDFFPVFSKLRINDLFTKSIRTPLQLARFYVGRVSKDLQGRKWYTGVFGFFLSSRKT